MKLEMDDNSTWTAIAILASLCLIVCSLGGCYLSEKTRQEAMKAGLEEQENIGIGGFHWAKPKSQ